MIGTKFKKNNYKVEEYAEAAAWANNNNAFIEDCGEYYEVKAIPAKSFEELKAEKLAALTEAKRSFDSQLINDKMIIISSLGFRINADLRSQNNLRGLLDAGADNVEFRDADNQGHAVTKADLQTMLIECIKNGEYLYAQAWQYEHDIEMTKTAKEVEEINLDFDMLDYSVPVD